MNPIGWWKTGVELPDVHFATRMPQDELLFVDEMLCELQQAGAISSTEYDRAGFERHRQRMRRNTITVVARLTFIPRKVVCYLRLRYSAASASRLLGA